MKNTSSKLRLQGICELRGGEEPEGLCRNGEEIGDKYSCTYGCPVNQEGYGICSKTMMLYPLMEAIRSVGDLRNVGGSDKYVKDIVCPDGCVMFRLKVRKLEGENPFHLQGLSLISGRKIIRLCERNIFINLRPVLYLS